MWSSHFFGMWLSYKIFILLNLWTSMRMAIKLSQRSKVFYFLCYFWFSCFKIHNKKNRRAGVRHTTHRNRIIVKMAETVLSNLHCNWFLLAAPSRKGLISENKTLAVSNAGSLYWLNMSSVYKFFLPDSAGSLDQCNQCTIEWKQRIFKKCPAFKACIPHPLLF